MGNLSHRAVSLLSATRFPFWGLQFHVVELTGTCRFGGDELRVLYAGTKPFFGYFKAMVFSRKPKEKNLGTYSIFALDQVRRATEWDIEVYRGHRIFANIGLFPSSLFVPEWISGTADLESQKDCDQTSKSRRRDRAMLQRNDISYRVTREVCDLDYFYEQMYKPHMQEEHADSVHLMTRDKMLSHVLDQEGRLVLISKGGTEVGGSLIIHEAGRPRLYSQGILNNDRELKRNGVGTAIYLCSYDHLVSEGYSEVHMGWSRALLADGSLYFKQRFGFQYHAASPNGHFINYSGATSACNEFLVNCGFIHSRYGAAKATIFRSEDDEQTGQIKNKQAMCRTMGLASINVVDLKPQDRQAALQS
jgi:hypothetical protein